MPYESRIPDVIDGMEQQADLVTEVTARQIEAGSKIRSRVDTGLMRNSWGVRVIGVAKRLVFNPVHYAIYNERGTHRMPAQPMLAPSLEEARPAFIKAAATVLTLRGRAKLTFRRWTGR